MWNNSGLEYLNIKNKHLLSSLISPDQGRAVAKQVFVPTQSYKLINQNTMALVKKQTWQFGNIKHIIVRFLGIPVFYKTVNIEMPTSEQVKREIIEALEEIMAC